MLLKAANPINKHEEEIKEEMLAIGGIHDGENGVQLTLEDTDIIVEKCNIHHGCKDKNPLDRMRFLPKTKMQKLTEPIDSLPEARMVDESTYESQLPRSFQANSIRIFSRNPEKKGLMAHVFNRWLEEIMSEMEITPTGEEIDMRPAMLTQETDDEQEPDDGLEYGYGHFSGNRNSVTPPHYRH